MKQENAAVFPAHVRRAKAIVTLTKNVAEILSVVEIIVVTSLTGNRQTVVKRQVRS